MTAGAQTQAGLPDEDGYELWLRYRPAVGEGAASAYRQAFAVHVVDTGCPSAQAVADELAVAARSLFGFTDDQIEQLPPDRLAAGVDAVVVGDRAMMAGLRIDDRTEVELRGADDGHVIFVDRSGGDALRLVVLAETAAARVRGLFELLRLVMLGHPPDQLDVVSVPIIRHRVLAHWDNLDRSVERGYAGPSLWRWNELPATSSPRYRDYARACASIGLNGSCLNNVNSVGEVMSDAFLAKVAAIADELRPYGIRVWLAPSWASPVTEGGLADADPSNPEVAAYWRDRCQLIYRLIPDFAGFQIKADSEGQPGPFQYGADHATGANVLARALAPHGGTVLWRAFVYDTDRDPDRAKCAYLEYKPLDGRFDQNVIVQVKNGPVDFQPREPFSPLFGAMEHTPVGLELQVTQEYLGHSTHLVYLAPMWTEILGSQTYAETAGATVAQVVAQQAGGLVAGPTDDGVSSAIIGVANTGSDRNWCGHHFGQANWYAFGRLAWDPSLAASEIADEWIALTWGRDEEVADTVASIMEKSWPACIDYMVPLGLHHLSEDGFHYGPEPDLANAPRIDWTNTYFHRADAHGVGFDRSSGGSDAVAHYHEPLRSTFDDIDRCPEELLLWFHHVSWDHMTTSGRRLLDELEARYRSGAATVEDMSEAWAGLVDRIDGRRHREVAERLARHVVDSRHWSTTCISYFQSVAGRTVVEADQL
jgi:alpha-glucuronidase